MKWTSSRCTCGITVWWKQVRGEMRPYEVDGFGQRTRAHICVGHVVQSDPEGHEGLYAACPYLRPQEDTE